MMLIRKVGKGGHYLSIHFKSTPWRQFEMDAEESIQDWAAFELELYKVQLRQSAGASSNMAVVDVHTHMYPPVSDMRGNNEQSIDTFIVRPT